MKKSNIKTFEELPYFINAQELADIPAQPTIE